MNTQHTQQVATKHTPGPWEVLPSGSDGLIIYDADNGRIAYMNDPVHGRDETLEANARLIASAPDLLAALRRLLELDDMMMNGRGVDIDSEESARNAARAAIAMATGS